MDANKKHISLEFYAYLCEVIGKEEVVKRRRHILQTTESVFGFENKYLFSIVSGSKAEGLNLPGSDLDIMKILKIYSVYECCDRVDRSLRAIPLIMDVDYTSPGFTKLYVSCDRKSSLIAESLVYIRDKQYVSSALFRNFFLTCANKTTSCFVHGPCICASDEFDLVIGFHCKSWISQAKDFIRRTKYSWASKDVLENILQFGVLFVPIGSKRSKETELEWRISFSFAEKLLIWSFNHVQLLCYALLKILLREVIKKKMPDSFADLLCSYFLKTIMFWLCEETDASQWKPESLLSCFNMAFKRLLYCVENKTLLHFFIPENNFFKDRFTNQQYKVLISNLKDLLNIGWTCLLETETLKSFRERNTSSLTSSDILTVSYLPCLFLSSFSSDRFKNINDMHSSVYFCIQFFKNTFLQYQLSNTTQLIAQNIEADEGDSNKKSYNRYRKHMCHLLIGTNHDAVSGWLLLASFFLCNKEYLKGQYLIDLCLSKLNRPDLILLNDLTRAEEHRFNLLRRKLGRHGDLLACKYFTAMFVEYNRSKLIFPEELTSFFSKNQHQYIHVSPVVFGKYIKFMCDRQVGNGLDRRKSLNILDELIVTVRSTKEWTIGDVACLESVLALC